MIKKYSNKPRCPHCNVIMFSSESTVLGGEREPSDQDLTICTNCGGFGIYLISDNDWGTLKFRKALPSDLDEYTQMQLFEIFDIQKKIRNHEPYTTSTKIQN